MVRRSSRSARSWHSSKKSWAEHLSVLRRASYLGAELQSRFVLTTEPASGPVRGAVIFVPPFAEELNKSRRMVALAAESFANAGWRVVQPDLFGCGDSAGEFRDATWQQWCQDIEAVVTWQLRSGVERVLPWSLRAGALVVSDWLALSGRSLPWLMWQPMSNGKQCLSQFLRLRTAGEMVRSSGEGGGSPNVRQELAAAGFVEVGGYCLGSALASGLEMSTLRVDGATCPAVRVVEVGAPGRTELSPGVKGLIDRAVANGCDAVGRYVEGPSFWQTQEIEIVPGLAAMSVGLIEELAG